MSIEIIPHWGFGQVKFGLSRKVCEEQLGKPTDSFEEEIDGSKEIVWDYNNLGFDLSFSSDDGYKLGIISIYGEDAILLGTEFIGLTEDELLDAAVNAGIEDLELEEVHEEFDSKDYYSEAHGVSFWLIDGVVDSITIFPAEDPENDDCPIWPD